MRTMDELIADFTARQYGLIARWQALAVGIPSDVLDVRVANGTLVIVHPGVYRLRGAPYTQELRWLAAVLAAGPEAWLSHRAAGAFHGFAVRRTVAEVSMPHGRECTLEGVEVHRTRRRGDVIVVRGIPVTTKARTILDIAAVEPFSIFETLLQDAVTSGQLRVEEVLAILDRRGGRGVSGTVATRTALEGGLVDEKIQRKLELLVARIIDEAGVPTPHRQYPLTCADGRAVVLDNAWPEHKLAIEADGQRWHGNAKQAAATRARHRSITATGWRHYPYGWSDATDGVAATQREIQSFWAGSTARWPVDPAQNGEGSDEDAA